MTVPFKFGIAATMGQKASRIQKILESLTSKQLQALALVAQGRTNKEIASELGISVSAAVQRIEAIRARFHGVSKAELGRIYREHCAEPDCNEITGNSFQVHHYSEFPPKLEWDEPNSHLTVADLTFEANPPWSVGSEKRLVPEMLDGKDAATYRWVVVFGLAIGMAVLSLVLLAVAGAMSDML